MQQKYTMDHRFGTRLHSSVPITMVGAQNMRFNGRVSNFSISGIYVDSPEFCREPVPRVEIELKRRRDGMPCSFYGHIVRTDKNGVAVMLDDAMTATCGIYDILCEYNLPESSSTANEVTAKNTSERMDPANDIFNDLEISDDAEDSLNYLVEFIRNNQIRKAHG